jgi:hypothetical protein
MSIALFMLAFMGGLVGLYGAGIVFAVRRAQRDAATRGVLSAPDGQTFLLEEHTGGNSARRAHYHVSRTMVALPEGAVTRVAVSGVEVARELGFRLQGKTRASSSGLEGRLVVDGTKEPDKARRLFARDEVNLALRVLCGSSATFRAINLYPEGGDLVVDVSDGPVDDLIERLLRFAEVIDEAAPHLGSDMPRLGATSGSASSAAFSIEIRS